MKISKKYFLSKELITYMGNKRSLIYEIEAQILEIIASIGVEKISFADVFAGSGVVSRMAKWHSSSIYTNDLEYYSKIINEVYLSEPSLAKKKKIIDAINEIKKMIIDKPIEDGYIRKNYSPVDEKNIKLGERVFYTPKNAIFIDSVIFYSKNYDESIRKYIIASLLVESSIHVNTAGIFKGFYKDSKTKLGQFGGSGENALSRIKGDIEIKLPATVDTNTKIQVFQMESLDFVGSIPKVDVMYLDPPYNQHPYGSNYFMLNLIAKDARPQKISKVSGIPEDWNRSQYNKSAFAKKTLIEVCEKAKATYLIISYNSEGFIKYDEFVKELNKIGSLEKIVQIKYNTFRGSRNLNSRELHVKEFLFIVKKDKNDW